MPAFRAAALQQELDRLGAKRIIKVAFLGNTGRGKSFLSNVCLGEHVFAQKFQPQSCTSFCSYAVCMVDDIAYVLCDVPGLLEADASMIERNEKCIEEATTVLPGSEMLLIFVMGVQVGGRMCGEDIEAHRAVMRFLPDFPVSARAVVVNGLNSRRFRTKEAEIGYRLQMKDAVHEMIHPDLAVHFTEAIPGSHDEQLDFENPQVQDMRDLLFGFLSSSLTPAVTRPPAGAKVELDSQKLQSEIAELQRQREEIERRHKEELENHRKQMEDRIAQERAALERQLAAARAAAPAGGGGRRKRCSIM